MTEEYDVIIVGGGCAGYPAAIYAARFNLKTLVIAKEKGGLITTTHLVENYPGFISLTGQELADHLEAHVKANNVPIENDIVSDIKKEGDEFILTTEIFEKTYKAKAVVIATGSKHRHLGVPGEWDFATKGVSYCATCDGMFFKGKNVCMDGGGDAAAKEAMVLASHAKHVTVFVRRDVMRAEPINQKRLEELENVTIEYNTQIEEIKGDKVVQSITLNREVNGSKEMQMDGVFIAIGQEPQSELAKNLGCELNERGEIIIDRLSQTNVPGVMSAGDVTNMPWKQGIVGAAEGSVAGYSAFEYINNK